MYMYMYMYIVCTLQSRYQIPCGISKLLLAFTLRLWSCVYGPVEWDNPPCFLTDKPLIGLYLDETGRNNDAAVELEKQSPEI